MTSFQMVMLLVFAGLVLAAYGKDIFAFVRGALNKVQLPAVPTPVAPWPKPSTPAAPQVKEIVDDLLMVASLRDRLAAEGCKEGADACSILLKIVIDHKHPHAG